MAKLLPGYNKKQKLLKESTENNGKDVYLTGIYQVFDEEKPDLAILAQKLTIFYK